MKENETQETYWDYMGRKLREGTPPNIVKVEADADGNLVLPIPSELLNQMGWDIGDTLIWNENFNGYTKSYSIRKKVD